MPLIVVKKFAFDLELLTVASLLGYKKILEAPINLNFDMNVKKSFIKEIKRIIRMSKELFQDTLAIIYRLRIIKYYQRVQAGEITNPYNQDYE